MKRTLFFVSFAAAFAFAAHADELRIVTNESMPTNYFENGKLTGTSVDIVEEIKRFLNVDVEIKVMPWARSYATAKQFPNVVIFTAAKTPERMDLGFRFIGPIITRKHALYKRKSDTMRINDLNDVKKMGLAVGCLRGDWREKFLRNAGIKTDVSAEHENVFKKLMANRTSLMVSSDIKMPILAKKSGIDIHELEPAFVFKTAPSYIMISKGTDPKTVKEWEQAFLEIRKTDFYENASKKWSGILSVQMDYSPDKGFYVKSPEP